MRINTIMRDGVRLYFPVDDLGMPAGYAYPTYDQAMSAGKLFLDSDGLATVPEGIDLEVE